MLLTDSTLEFINQASSIHFPAITWVKGGYRGEITVQDTVSL